MKGEEGNSAIKVVSKCSNGRIFSFTQSCHPVLAMTMNSSSNSTFSCQDGKLEMLITIAVSSFLALIHNALFSVVAYKLNWFNQPQFFLICNQVVVDLTENLFHALVAAGESTPWYWALARESANLNPRFRVILFLCTLCLNMALDISQKSSLIVAIDRFNFVVNSVKMGPIYCDVSIFDDRFCMGMGLRADFDSVSKFMGSR